MRDRWVSDDFAGATVVGHLANPYNTVQTVMDKIGAFGEIPASMNYILIHEGGRCLLREAAGGLRGDITLGGKPSPSRSNGNPRFQ